MGYVGGALKHWLDSRRNLFEIFLYDKYKKIGSVSEVNRATMIFIAVPTPFNRKSGGYDDSAVKEAISTINDCKTVVIKSTVLPGSTEKFQEIYPRKTILFNPEFLRARTANGDLVRPDRQIVGFANQKGKKIASKVLGILPKAPFSAVVRSKEAEMIKYFSNSYLATRVVFANQIYDLCQKLGGIDYDVVKKCLVRDRRIGDSHFEIFHEGYRGYAGGCFPKDVRALLQLAGKMKVDMGLLRAAERINGKLIRRNKSPKHD